MANKKTTMPKMPGADDKGNIKIAGNSKVLDLSDFDDLFDEPTTSKKTPLEEFKEGFKSSFKDRLGTKEIVRNFLRSAAPDGISRLFGTYEDVMSGAKSIKDHLEDNNAGDLQFLMQRAKDYLPKLKEYIPSAPTDRISSSLEQKIEQYQYTTDSKRNLIDIRRQQKEESENAEIKEALDQVSLVSLDNFQKQERATVAREAMKRAERATRDNIGAGRFDFMAKAMGRSVDSLTRLAAYNEQIGYTFQRKGLELQFRTYMGIKDLVKLQQAQLELQSDAFTALVRNTGLPDFKKGANPELTNVGKSGQHSSVMKRMAGSVGQNIHGFLGNWDDKVQGSVKNSLSSNLSNIVSSAKMASMMGGASMWDQKYNLLGQGLGELAASYIHSDVIPDIGRRFKPTVTNFAQKHGGRHHQVNYALDNIPAFLQEFINNGQNQHGFKGVIRDLIAPHVPQFSKHDRLQTGTYQTINQQASFNQLTQRTITEAIPGLLARAVQELRMIRTGKSNVPMEVWDVSTGKFVNSKESDQNQQDRIVTKSQVRNASMTMNETLNGMDTEGKLSPAARHALSERIMRDASHNRRFDPEQYVRASGYHSSVHGDTTDELSRFFHSKFAMTKGKMDDTAENQELRNQFSVLFQDIRNVSKDPYKEISSLVAAGKTDQLRAMGLVITEQGIDKINYERVWEILRSGVSDHNAEVVGDDIDRFYDGDPTHKRFVGPHAPSATKRAASQAMSIVRKRHGKDIDKFKAAAENHIATIHAAAQNAHSNVMAKGGYGNAFNQGYGQAKDKASEHFSKAMDAATKGYGNIADAASKGYAGAMDAAHKGYGHASTAYDLGMGHIKPMVEEASKKAQDQTSSLIDRYKQSPTFFDVAQKDKLMDLFSKFNPKDIVIKGIDFIKGNLIDVNTKKVIESVKDITGAVVNQAGMTVITAQEAANGLYDSAGELVHKTTDDKDTIISKALGKQPKQEGSEGSEHGESEPGESQEELDNQDWCKAGEKEPVITAQGLKNGDYFDDETGEPIKSMADIKGPVADKNHNIIVTGEDLKLGLFSRLTGRRLKTTGVMGFVGRMTKGLYKMSKMSTRNIYLHALKFMGKAAVGMAYSALNFFVESRDAYMPEDNNPVFTRRALKNGEYFDEKGKTITNFSDVYGPIFDSKGEPVLPTEDYIKLLNYDGTRHELAKNRGIRGLIRKVTRKPLRWMRRKYIDASKKYYKWLGRTAVKAGGWLGKKTLGGFARTGGFVLNRLTEKIPYDELKTPTEQMLGRVVEAVQTQTQVMADIEQQRQAHEAQKEEATKEPTAGSWQDKAKKKANGLMDKFKKGYNSDDKDGDKKSGMFGKFFKGLKGMFGKGEAEEGSTAAEEALGLGKKRGFMSMAGNLLKNPYVLGGIAGTIGVGGSMISNHSDGYSWGQSALLTASKVTPFALPLQWIMKKVFNKDNAAKALGGDEFGPLRMMQYGITDAEQQNTILKLEAMLEKTTNKKDDDPDVSIASIGGKELLALFKIDVKSPAQVKPLAIWLDHRFIPVFKAYCKAMNKVGKGDLKFADIDSKVPDGLKVDFANAVTFPYDGDTPYACTADPFSVDGKLENLSKDIQSKLADIIAKYKDSPKPAASEALKDTAKKAGAATVAASTDASKDAASTANTEDITRQKNDPLPAPGDNKFDAKTQAKYYADAVAGLGSTSSIVAGLTVNVNALSGLQAIRFRAYGLQTLDKASVRGLIALEDIFAQGTKVQGQDAEYTADTDALIADAAQCFGKNMADEAERSKFINWLFGRFAPVARTYILALNQFTPNFAKISTAEGKLKPSDAVTVAQAVMGAKTEGSDTIWSTDSIFEIKGDPSDLKKLADADLKALQDLAAKDIARTPTQNAGDQAAGKANADGGGSFASKVMGGIKDGWNATKDAVSGAASYVGDKVSSAYASTSEAISTGVQNVKYNLGMANEVTTQGQTSELTKGNGGAWGNIPMPTSKTAAACRPTMDAIAAMVGVSADLLMTFAGLESNYDWTVSAKTSSATGWFQFINSTWDAMIKKYGPTYGVPPDDAARSLRKDPRINGLMGACYMKECYQALQKGLGRAPSDTDIYMAHFLGPGGALQFLKANQNALGTDVMPKVASANKSIFFKQGGQPRTLAEIYQLMDAKVAKFRKGGLGKGAATDPKKDIKTTTPGDVGKEQAEATAKAAEADAGKDTPAKGKDDSQSIADAKTTTGTPIAPQPGGSSGGLPMVPSAPGATGATPSAPGAPASGGNSTQAAATDSGASTAAQQQQQQLAAAQQQNALRQNEVKQNQQATNDVTSVQQDQLKALQEILKRMDTVIEHLATSNDAKGTDQGSAPPPNGRSGNNMTSPIMGRTASSAPSPLTLR